MPPAEGYATLPEAVDPAPARIALTGATGFIGRRLSLALADPADELRCLVRPGGRIDAGSAVTGSLADRAALERLFDGVDAVVHCAGAVRGSGPADFLPANVDGLRLLVECLRAVAPRAKLVHLSSLAAREPSLSDYAASKAGGERLLHECGAGLAWTILRPPAVYGPGDREILPLFRAMRRGWLPTVAPRGARLSLLFVDDLVNAVEASLRRPAEGAVLELDDGRPGGYGWEDIAAGGERVFRRRVRLVRLPAPLLRGAAALNQASARVLGYAPMLRATCVRPVVFPAVLLSAVRKVPRSFAVR